ncbi:transcriptional regulator, TetR family [Jatrophihabitans endophyticus]|uniref:Transcriptional regulator, TetR family n=1 Tax=Jatrophihabitans endophyticus TaxID=1206085 RepID=A0A1M5K5P5_9ACTN|nr:TetR family transcriptional regulator [Jatrophihabitans endophyticus]SHG47799.1 transcriptional regulator, TetR family [Jatrophihabitans endophyticus]
MTGLRERKRTASRSGTVDAAFRLFLRDGYDDVTVAQICDEAGIGRRTFFRYFAAKEDVLLEPMREIAASVDLAIAAAPAELPDAEALRHALSALADDSLHRRRRLVEMRTVLRDSRPEHVSAATVLSDHEWRIAGLLAARHGHDEPDWRTRLMVARTIAGFRVWLDDVVTGAVADPRAHLQTILDAPLAA